MGEKYVTKDGLDVIMTLDFAMKIRHGDPMATRVMEIVALQWGMAFRWLYLGYALHVADLMETFEEMGNYWGE